MPGPVRTVLQAFKAIAIIALLPAIKGLGANIEVTTSKPGILSTGVIVVKPLESLLGLFGWLNLKPCQARGSRQNSVGKTHNTTIISPFHLLSSVTYLN